MPSQVSGYVSLSEAVALVARLDRQPVTGRQFRHLDRGLGVVRPVRLSAQPNAGRFYTAEDVGMVRLMFRMGAARGQRQAWAAARYLAPEIRTALAKDGAGRAVVFTDGVARVLPTPRAGARGDVFELVACMRGVREAIRACQADARMVWSGAQWAPRPDSSAMGTSRATARTST